MNPRTTATAVLATTATLTAVALPATPAAATAARRAGCAYPYVCLYKGSTLNNPTGRFKDVTTGWQWLTRSKGATAVVNTRKDDVAYLLQSNGRVICVKPNETGGVAPGTAGFVAIRISWSRTC